MYIILKNRYYIRQTVKNDNEIAMTYGILCQQYPYRSYKYG